MHTQPTTPHISLDELADYFAVLLPEAQMGVIEEHLAVCDACIVQARHVRRISHVLQSWNVRTHGEAYQRALLGLVAAAVEKQENPEMPDPIVVRLGSVEHTKPVQIAAAVEIVMDKRHNLSTVHPKIGGDADVYQTAVEVDVEQGAVIVWCLRSKAPTLPPHVLLVPYAENAEISTALPSYADPAYATSVDVVRFSQIPDGRYLVVVIPS